MKTLLVASSIAVAVGGYFLFDNNVEVSGAKSTETVIVETGELIDSGKVKYAITKDNDQSKELEVTINIQNDFTNDDMKKYKELNKRNIEKLSKGKKDIPTTITFSKPLSVEEFNSLVDKYDITVENFNIIAEEEDNGEQYIQGVPDGDNLIPKNKLNEVLKNSQFKGVYSFEGLISPQNIVNVSEDQTIFLADVSEDILTGKAKRIQKADEKLDVNVYDVYWFVEEIK